MKLPATFAFTFLVLVYACRAQDSPTNDELDAKIKALTDQQLVICLKEKAAFTPIAVSSPATVLARAFVVPGAGPGCLFAQSARARTVIDSELAERKHPDILITAYRNGDPQQRLNLVQALTQIDDPKVVAFMSTVAFQLLGPPAESFPAIEYLAERCDEPALERLSDSVPIGRIAAMECGGRQWRPLVEAFLRCDYRAAAPKLVRALRAPCSDINDAAEEGLQGFFPGSCWQAYSIAEQESCYERLLNDSPTKSALTTDH